MKEEEKNESKSKTPDVDIASDQSSPGVVDVNTITKSESPISQIHPLMQYPVSLYRKVKEFLEPVKKFLFSASIEEAEYIEVIEKDVEKNISPSIKFGFSIVGIAVAFFGVWASLAPIDSAVVAQGSISLSGNRKIIQHMEGGIIDKILVKDGDHVQKGQELIILNSEKAKSDVEITISKLRFFIASKARLDAQQQLADSVDFKSSQYAKYLDFQDESVVHMLNTQNEVFKSTMKFHKSELEGIDKKITQVTQERESLLATLKAYKSQLRSAQDSLKIIEKTAKQGLVKKTDLNEREYAVHGIEGHVNSTESAILKAEAAIQEYHVHRLSTEKKFLAGIADELNKTQEGILETLQEYRKARDVLDRTIIRAPSSGVVTSLSFHTIGGVVHSNMKLLEIIPQDDLLLIEAFVDTKDRDSIHVGSKVKIQLDAFKSRIVPRLDGFVTYISADKADQQGGDPRMQQAGAMRPVYVVKVAIDPKSIDAVHSNVQLQPGMPATVFIVKGERTFFTYLLTPFIDSLHRAFTEA